MLTVWLAIAHAVMLTFTLLSYRDAHIAGAAVRLLGGFVLLVAATTLSVAAATCAGLKLKLYDFDRLRDPHRMPTEDAEAIVIELSLDRSGSTTKSTTREPTYRPRADSSTATSPTLVESATIRDEPTVAAKRASIGRTMLGDAITQSPTVDKTLPDVRQLRPSQHAVSPPSFAQHITAAELAALPPHAFEAPRAAPQPPRPAMVRVSTSGLNVWPPPPTPEHLTDLERRERRAALKSTFSADSDDERRASRRGLRGLTRQLTERSRSIRFSARSGSVWSASRLPTSRSSLPVQPRSAV